MLRREQRGDEEEYLEEMRHEEEDRELTEQEWAEQAEAYRRCTLRDEIREAAQEWRDQPATWDAFNEFIIGMERIFENFQADLCDINGPVQVYAARVNVEDDDWELIEAMNEINVQNEYEETDAPPTPSNTPPGNVKRPMHAPRIRLRDWEEDQLRHYARNRLNEPQTYREWRESADGFLQTLSRYEMDAVDRAWKPYEDRRCGLLLWKFDVDAAASRANVREHVLDAEDQVVGMRMETVSEWRKVNEMEETTEEKDGTHLETLNDWQSPGDRPKAPEHPLFVMFQEILRENVREQSKLTWNELNGGLPRPGTNKVRRSNGKPTRPMNSRRVVPDNVRTIRKPQNGQRNIAERTRDKDFEQGCEEDGEKMRKPNAKTEDLRTTHRSSEEKGPQKQQQEPMPGIRGENKPVDRANEGGRRAAPSSKTEPERRPRMRTERRKKISNKRRDKQAKREVRTVITRANDRNYRSTIARARGRICIGCETRGHVVQDCAAMVRLLEAGKVRIGTDERYDLSDGQEIVRLDGEPLTQAVDRAHQAHLKIPSGQISNDQKDGQPLTSSTCTANVSRNSPRLRRTQCKLDLETERAVGVSDEETHKHYGTHPSTILAPLQVSELLKPPSQPTLSPPKHPTVPPGMSTLRLLSSMQTRLLISCDFCDTDISNAPTTAIRPDRMFHAVSEPFSSIDPAVDDAQLMHQYETIHADNGMLIIVPGGESQPLSGSKLRLPNSVDGIAGFQNDYSYVVYLPAALENGRQRLTRFAIRDLTRIVAFAGDLASAPPLHPAGWTPLT